MQAENEESFVSPVPIQPTLILGDTPQPWQKSVGEEEQELRNI